MNTSHKFGITLSGGGARGFAHIGVLQALEERGMAPDVICGTSAGAIIGSLYAYGYAPSEIREIANKSNLYKMFRLVVPRKGLTSQNYVRKQLLELIPQNNFECLLKPFHVGVTNLNSGKHEIFDSGPLHDIVLASSAVPGIFQPIEIDGQFYVDGGVMNNMPADPIRSHCEFLIASNVVTKVEKSNNELSGLKSILARVFEISLWYRSRLNYDACDMIIEPSGLHKYHIFNFGKSKEIYELGYRSAHEKLEQLEEEGLLVAAG